MIPDSHAHLDMIDREPGLVVASARAAGVAPIITIGITCESSRKASILAGSQESVYASVGIHPNDTGDATPDDFDRLKEIAQESGRVVAIGETGLDYYRKRSPAESQKDAFRLHVRLARELGKALVVHARDAHADALEILGEENAGETTVVMHCFSGNADVLKRCVERGYFISFAGPVTYTKAGAAREAAANTPEGLLLSETDSPFLSPEPFRGKPNSPQRVRLVAEELARLKGMTMEEMETLLEANVTSAFGIENGE